MIIKRLFTSAIFRAQSPAGLLEAGRPAPDVDTLGPHAPAPAQAGARPQAEQSAVGLTQVVVVTVRRVEVVLEVLLEVGTLA